MEQKSLVPAGKAQRTNQGRTPFICTFWVLIDLSFNSQQGPPPLYSSLSGWSWQVWWRKLWRGSGFRAVVGIKKRLQREISKSPSGVLPKKNSYSVPNLIHDNPARLAKNSAAGKKISYCKKGDRNLKTITYCQISVNFQIFKRFLERKFNHPLFRHFLRKPVLEF